MHIAITDPVVTSSNDRTQGLCEKSHYFECKNTRTHTPHSTDYSPNQIVRKIDTYFIYIISMEIARNFTVSS